MKSFETLRSCGLRRAVDLEALPAKVASSPGRSLHGQKSDRLRRIRQEIRDREGHAIPALGAGRGARGHQRAIRGEPAQVELKPWPRRGGAGVFINHDASRTSNDCYVCAIPPGGKLAPQRQLFEEMILVLDGRGSTSVWNDEGRRITFE